MSEDNSSQKPLNVGFWDRALGRARLRMELESKLSLREKKNKMLEKYLKENKHALSQLQKKMDERIRFDKGIYPLALDMVDKKLKLAKIEKNTIQDLMKGLSKQSLKDKMKKAKEKSYTKKLNEINDRVEELKYYKKEMEQSLSK